MITFNRLGTLGRLGNQLFQIASVSGIALKNGFSYAFPEWKYSEYFENPLPKTNIKKPTKTEKTYHYTAVNKDNVSYDGWYQSSTYWSGHEAEIKEQFKLKPLVEFPFSNEKETICISIRRGDFVGNKNYYQLPINYYILSLLEHFPNFEDYNILFTSDDIPYCKVHFECLPNAYFAEGKSDIEQLYLMTKCDHFIISNSTFSWWGAYLGEKENSKVIRPFKNICGYLEQRNSEKDYWQKNWIVFEHEGKRIDLTDFTFTIPVFIDHRDREENLNLTLQTLSRDFKTNIIIGEQGQETIDIIGPEYRFFDYKVFHRTKMLNEMALMATTKYVVNYDCDVVLPPMQFVLAKRELEKGADFVYPYDGRFARVPRNWYLPILNHDVGIVGDTEFKGKHGKPLPTASVGGCIIVNKESFISSGMEHEGFISFGPEDLERWYRWNKLGYKVIRIPGSLYHLDHFCGPNSSTKNPYFRKGHQLYDRIKKEKDLRSYVDSFSWKKIALWG